MKMFNEGNQIHNFMSSSGSGTVINYGSGSDFLTSYGYGSGSTSQKVPVPTVPVPVPVPQHCRKDPWIVVKGLERFKCHQFMLAARSPVLAAMQVNTVKTPGLW